MAKFSEWRNSCKFDFNLAPFWVRRVVLLAVADGDLVVSNMLAAIIDSRFEVTYLLGEAVELAVCITVKSFS